MGGKHTATGDIKEAGLLVLACTALKEPTAGITFSLS